MARRAYRRERHLWWELDLSAARPARRLPSGLELVELPREQAHRADSLGGVDAGGAGGAAERYGAGGTFGVLLDAENVVFGAWSFPDRIPGAAADDGWVRVPDGCVGIDGVVTAESHRRRGIATAGLTAIVDRLAERGHRTVLVRTASDDDPVARLLQQLRYRRAAVTNSIQVGSLRRVRVTAGAAPAGRVLADAIG